ncbi:MAG: tetratricopeptide repeat protein [Alphaproteobacteria bacterium]|nr:tetratricopeptide repeat protein [Alphaproteobacteria bacterium]
MALNRREHRFSKAFLLAFAASAALAACQPAHQSGVVPVGPEADIAEARQMSRAAKIDAALERAASAGAEKGRSVASLLSLEEDYKRQSKDPETVIAYARALREADYLNRALIILAPLAGKDDSPSLIKSEYATVNLGMGNYRDAETYARKAILANPENAKAFHVLGIALDAMGHHEQAEVAFRKGLDYWEGDPTPIMNNLALNLASQGLIDEASEILHRAAAAAPNRPEIERNLRIVSALRQSTKTARPRAIPGAEPDKIVLPPRKPSPDDEAE